MKKTFVITSILLAFFCFSCDDEPLDENIAIEVPTTTPTDPTDPVDPTDPTDPTDPGTTGSLTTYSYDLTTNTPFLGEIIANTDFNIQQGIVVGQNIESTVLGFTFNSIGTNTRNANGNIILVEDTIGGMPSNRTTITYDGENITQIEYEFFEDPTENYTYNFTYSGNIITKTFQGTDESSIFTFDPSTSRIIKVENFVNGITNRIETFMYTANGNCSQSIIEEGGDSETQIHNYDTNPNPLKAVFADSYLFSILNGDNEEDIGGTIANFHSTNNWIGVETSVGPFSFNATYDADNKILSKSGNYDLGDDITIVQSESYQY